MERTKVGFIGLGLMGSRMARNLARAGLLASVWSRTSSKATALAGERPDVVAAGTPAQLAREVDVVCSCVADPEAIEQVAFWKDGLFETLREGQLWIELSTLSPAMIARLHARCTERGVDFVEAPVTGSKTGAEKATLLMMVGASEPALERARPVLEKMGEKIIRCGEVGDGTHVKLAGNAVIAMMLQGLSEGLLLSSKAGVPAAKVLEVIGASGYRSPYYDFKGKALVEHDFETHFSIDLMFKDLTLFLQSAADQRVPTPAVAAVREVYQLARAAGRGEQDIAAVIAPLEELAGVRIS